MALTPDRLSLGFRLTETSVLFQPEGAETVVLGAVLSILTAWLATGPLLLPALSLTEALAVRPVPSLEMVLSAGQLPSIPDPLLPSARVGSLQLQLIVTLPLYQPAPLALVVAVPVSMGGVKSTLMLPAVTCVLLPALSKPVSVTDGLVPSPLTVLQLG